MAVLPARQSPFGQVFDVVVVGSGVSGFAATTALRRAGRSVLLLGTRGDLVWESGRAFCPDAGDADDADWRRLVEEVDQRGGHVAGWLDGAITEVVATSQLLASGASVLYYAQPVAVECAGAAGTPSPSLTTSLETSLVTSVVVATKSGLQRVSGRQWVDATESGELSRLIDPDLTPRAPEQTSVHLMLQHPDWSQLSEPSEQLSNRSARSGLRATAWPTERVLTVEVTADDAAWREQVLVALAELEDTLGDDIADVSTSHLSIEPISRYAVGAAAQPPAANVAVAVPGMGSAAVATLADRFMLGVHAVATLGKYDAHDASTDLLTRSLPDVEPSRTLRTDVCVTGAGTGGAVAAVAAGRAGANVVCVEPLAFAGGIGTGGGIHGYWFGVAGGLQQEVDRRTRHLMKRFRSGPLGDGPFNPWAKMIVLEQMMREQGVELHTGALLFDVEKRGDRVTAAMIATPAGVLRVEADAFVDGTGDGDLCALAGAEFTYGREHDGLSHAYTQSSGVLREARGRPRMGLVNFDAGFCDPTDPADLTRARLVGVHQYLIERYDNFTRPTYIAPALGLRQGRQVITEYVLTLDDQIRRRRFNDPIGYTGAHYDNHGSDFESESDEAVFWIWGNRQLTLLVACEMSYRMLIPRGVDNVWIASRCLGVSQDAHYTSRMQRDMQRAGEAAGYAAAEAGRLAIASSQLPYATLRAWLDQTGALDKKPRSLDTGFGSFPWGGESVSTDGLVSADDTSPDETSSVDEASYVNDATFVDEALVALDRGEPGEAIWWLYTHRDLVHDAVLARLEFDDGSYDGTGAGRQPMVSWLAAAVAAMWQDTAAEPRLIRAIESREYGFGDGYEWTPVRHMGDPTSEPLAGSPTSPTVPNWLCAIALLRRCGTAACLPAIERLLEHPAHGLNTLTTVAITLERLVQLGTADSDDMRARVEAMLERILSVRVVGAIDYAGFPGASSRTGQRVRHPRRTRCSRDSPPLPHSAGPGREGQEPLRGQDLAGPPRGRARPHRPRPSCSRCSEAISRRQPRPGTPGV